LVNDIAIDPILLNTLAATPTILVVLTFTCPMNSHVDYKSRFAVSNRPHSPSYDKSRDWAERIR